MSSLIGYPCGSKVSEEWTRDNRDPEWDAIDLAKLQIRCITRRVQGRVINKIKEQCNHALMGAPGAPDHIGVTAEEMKSLFMHAIDEVRAGAE